LHVALRAQYFAIFQLLRGRATLIEKDQLQ
jgi:hypothetical protein